VKVPSKDPRQPPLVIAIPRTRSRRHEQQVARILNELILTNQLEINEDGNWSLVLDGGTW
jgi:hypothetical protein